MRKTMATIQKNSRAATLVAAIEDTDQLSLERLALLSGIPLADLRDCRDRKATLPADAQVRLARTVGARVPRLIGTARRLERQAVAALQMERGSTALHMTAPATWR
jgi:hypothetical protein